ncbi:MAG: trypsin-like peptidase domain-containing protein [Bacteroidales bacterium]|nr:trypsin-like peptidase domain-containing protein [Bacteroidales bacterium]
MFGKARWLIFGLTTTISQSIYGQLSVDAIPFSFKTKLKSAYEIPATYLSKLSIDSLTTADSLLAIPNRFGILEYVSIDIKEKGVLTHVGDSLRIWQYRLSSPNALALGVRFGYFRVPPGAKLFLYNPQHTKLLGAYTHLNNKDDGFFSIQPFTGHEVIIEYEEPINSQFDGVAVIQAVSKAYRSFNTTVLYNDINCPGWERWQTIKRAVCRIIFDDVDGSYYCTGSLINNTRFDATPYFLTANHCINSQFSASSVVVYFNYETNSCNGNVTNNNQTLSGATLCAHASETDFSLLKLTESPPESYNPYFAGWDITGQAPTESAVIHHPKGLSKSIAYSSQKGKLYPYSINWDDGSTSPKYTHWEITFTNGNTNSGSSGSPLLNSDLNIIGQLHGGDNTINYYGSIAVSWNLGTSPSRQLKIWLDPDNTGVQGLEGTDGKVFPKAKFDILPEIPCINAPVMLKNLSINNPKQWQWNIYPSTFIFMPDSNQQATTDTSKNPVVSFIERGNYTIKLIASNAFGSDTLTKSIAVGDIQTSFVYFPADSPLCGNSIKNLKFEASGAYDFYFGFDTVRYFFWQDKNKLYLTLKDTSINDSTFIDNIRVNARHGQCSSMAEKTIQVYNIPNDRVRNALPLRLGMNGPFDNTCASYEIGEPHPDDGGCSVPNNWCYNAKNPDIVVNRSLWFTFIGPASGQINIQTQGLDTRVALYETNSVKDLLSSKYRLIAASDNTESGVEASLSNISVIPGRKYWMQVDANANAKGSFTINLFSRNIELSPNPANKLVKITLPISNGVTGTISISSTDGKMYMQKIINSSPTENTYWFDCSLLPSGLYLVRFTSVLGSYSTKLLIVHMQ